MFNTKKLTKLFAIGALALGVLVVAGCGDDTSKEAKVNPDAKVINVATRGTVRPYSYSEDVVTAIFLPFKSSNLEMLLRSFLTTNLRVE